MVRSKYAEKLIAEGRPEDADKSELLVVVTFDPPRIMICYFTLHMVVIVVEKVKKMVPAMKKYAEKLIAEGVMTAEEYEQETKRYDQVLEDSYEAGKKIER